MYELIKLPYANDALGPVISKQTIELHHGKHLATYVNNLNSLVPGTEFEGKSIEEIIKTAPAGGIFNNAGQILNHNLYFTQFKANGGGAPTGKLADAIKSEFGSFESFKEKFTNDAVTLFGSGWAWLAKDSSGKLSVIKEINAGNPLTSGKTPVFTFDVWEHAYYVDYQNRRAEHIKALWDIVDWEAVGSRY